MRRIKGLLRLGVCTVFVISLMYGLPACEKKEAPEQAKEEKMMEGSGAKMQETPDVMEKGSAPKAPEVPEMMEEGSGAKMHEMEGSQPKE